MEITGATPEFARRLRAAIEKYPSWFVTAARLSKIEVTSRPEVREQIAMYEHGSRNLYVWPGVGDLLQKAIGHELAHAVDDNFDNPHFFTSTPEWKMIHRNQGHFDIAKYEQEPLEYFADCVTKVFLLGPTKFKTTNPQEVQFICTWVFPTLQQYFS